MAFSDIVGFSEDNVLQRFTRDLTADARAGRLEPVRARDNEVSRVIDILLRHGKNNPALVGPAGVGKTAIVEGLAQRVAAGAVPLSLRDVRIMSVDHVSLLAGTTFRGQYEDRIKGLIAETAAAPDVILFVDELHNLIGQGTAMGAAMDAANMLKPALVRGDFRLIGATTDEEYDRWVCGDPALERRFQKVTVRELSSEETLDILRSRQLRLERHHNVVISDEALAAAVRLTDEHVGDRMRPDRAIDALDEACAHTHAEARYSAETERLILARRELVRMAKDGPRDGKQQKQEPQPGRGASARAGDPDAYDPEDDPLERAARNGFSALERFGAEIEALFTGEVVDAEGRERGDRVEPKQGAGSGGAPAGGAQKAAQAAADRIRTLAELDAELQRRLMEEGAVVRAHDVARVVAVATGRRVKWPI